MSLCGKRLKLIVVNKAGRENDNDKERSEELYKIKKRNKLVLKLEDGYKQQDLSKENSIGIEKIKVNTIRNKQNGGCEKKYRLKFK